MTLKEWLNEKHGRATWLSEVTGCEEAAISRYKNGTRTPSINVGMKIELAVPELKIEKLCHQHETELLKSYLKLKGLP